MDLNAFMNAGAQDILKTATHYYLHSVRGARYLAHAAKALSRAQRERDAREAQGVHVPPFLIASIASECNLNCTGCYAHANGTIGSEPLARELADNQWERIFAEAREIGVSFILLAGGEPTLRRGVIEAAAACDDVIFPVFTNGTTMDESWVDLFDEHRNLVPVFSVEGTDRQTDERRGPGVAARVREAARRCTERGILWGASLTVTTANIDEVTSRDYVRDLHDRGCGLLVYNEFVPIDSCTTDLALPMSRHDELMRRMDDIHADQGLDKLIAIAFPGNEEFMGGCLAAGRGFFHISQAGNAEPCPFSPYSVANVADVGLVGALTSPFFARIREIEAEHADEHMGGCTLFMNKLEVEQAQRDFATA